MLLSAEFHQKKYEQLQAILDEHCLDGLLLFELHNVYYLSGLYNLHYERPQAVYIPAKGEPILFLPRLDSTKPTQTESCWVKDIRVYFEFPGPIHPAAWMVRQLGVNRLGVDDVPISFFNHIRSEVDSVAYTDLVNRLRYVKEPEEIERIRIASRYADALVEASREAMRVGITELEVFEEARDRVKRQIDDEIGVGVTMPILVGRVLSGPSSASPHGRPGNHRIAPGEVAILSMGAAINHYHSESERVFFVGEPSQEYRNIFDVMYEAQQAGTEAMQVGERCCDVNARCLDIIKQAGYEQYLYHRMGHGVGLQGHEAPWIEEGDRTIIQPNMVFSNEPGIYVPALGGFRHSDVLVVAEDGPEYLTKYPRTLEDMVIPV